MSFLTGKSKDKDPFSKKSQFYVQFLGWMECRGVRGHRYTEPVIRELRRRQEKLDKPPKLTIQVSRKDLKITQDVEDTKKRTIKKIKFPVIQSRDVTFVHQARRGGQLDDIVACIYLGYMPRTQRNVHVHVYRFDEANTATTFARQMAVLVENNKDYVREVERALLARGEIDDPRLSSSDGMSEQHTTDSAVGSASSAYSDEDDIDDVEDDLRHARRFGSDEVEPDLQSLHDVQPYDNVANELKHRLQLGQDQPILLPPKDYDTISRAHGNVDQANMRRCLNLSIVGEGALNVINRERNGSNESGVDMASPGSDTGVDSTTAVTGERSEGSDGIPSIKQSDYRNSPVVSPMQHRKPIPSFDPPASPLVHPKPGSHPGSISPGTPPPGVQALVYPPKPGSPPMSPRMYRPTGGNRGLVRQGSQTSHNSEHSRHSHPSDEGQMAPPIIYKGAASTNDLYALPIPSIHRRTASSPVEEIPPDYVDADDGEVEMRPSSRRRDHQQQMLTRSMPADMIRSEMVLGSNSRPNSGSDFRNMRRVDSPVFVGGAGYHHGQHLRTGNGPYSPRISKR